MRKRLIFLLLVAFLCAVVPVSTSASSWEDRLDEAHQAGFESGYEAGYGDGRSSGYETGYERGYDDGRYNGRQEAEEETERRQENAKEERRQSWYGLFALIGFLVAISYIINWLDNKRHKQNRTVSHISLDGENCTTGDAILAEPFMPLNILRSHYRDGDGDLVLKMEDGSEYCYYDFPEKLYSEMMHSGNPVAFIQRNVRGKYICEKIE